jgi:dTDP-glucose pyrophosphorylase
MDIEKLKTGPECSVREAIATIDRVGLGAALVVGADDKLIGILTDGDIRRAILQGFDLSRPVADLLREQVREFGPAPLSMPVDAPRRAMIAFLERYKVRHLPLLDPDGRLVTMVTHEELIGASQPRIKGVIMAGGFGTRLRPLTESTPKPMLAIGGKPILERLIDHYKQNGIGTITLVVYYKKEIIQDYFEDGAKWGITIDYVEETEPRGTAGAISHIPVDDRLLLVTNGDILTNVNFEQMEHFHREHDASLSMAVVNYESIIPYGVVEMRDYKVNEIVEKPRSRHFINAGIYLVSPDLCSLVPKHGVYNMTDLIQDTIGAGHSVLGFPVREYWRDIGQHDDFKQAELDVAALA